MSFIKDIRIVISAVCASMPLIFAPGACAQVITGTILGAVRDQSGGVIPKVTVTVTNTGTNVSTTATTGAAGEYTIPLLPPGT